MQAFKCGEQNELFLVYQSIIKWLTKHSAWQIGTVELTKQPLTNWQVGEVSLYHGDTFLLVVSTPHTGWGQGPKGMASSPPNGVIPTRRKTVN